MAFVNSVKDITAGMGSGTSYVSVLGTSVSAGTGSITLPASGSFSPSPMTSGIIRIKSLVVGTNATFYVSSITGTDGTTTEDLILPAATATAANHAWDLIFFFRTDLNLTSITINVTVGTAACTMDAEVIGNP